MSSKIIPVLLLIFVQVKCEVDDAKSSLVFVFDTTGSMYNDLKQLREGAEMILKTALEDGNVVEDFVFVPFHDPLVGPATVTQDKEVLKAALARVSSGYSLLHEIPHTQFPEGEVGEKVLVYKKTSRQPTPSAPPAGL